MKKKCRDSMIGDKNPMYGKSWKDFSTDEKIKNHRINISNSLKRRYKDKKNRDLTASASKKMWESNNFKEKYHKNNSKKVHMYDKDMNYIRTFDSLWDALKFLNLKSHTTILKAIKENKLYKGYYWRREEQKGVTTREIRTQQRVEKIS